MSDRFTRRIHAALSEGRDLSTDEMEHLARCSTCGAAADGARAFEAALVREFEDHGAPMPADPFAVSDSRRPPWSAVPGPAAIVAVLLFAVVGGALLSAPDDERIASATSSPSATTPLPSPSPSASPRSPSPRSSPRPSPSEPASPTDEAAVRPGDYALTATTEVSLRDLPGGTEFAVIQPGADLYVLDVRDGWAEVQAPVQFIYEYVFGWVPVEELQHRAPPQCLEVDPGSSVWFGNVSHPQRDLECNGATGQIVARGFAIDRRQDPPGPYDGTPSWLGGDAQLELAAAIGPAVTTVWTYLYLPPDLQGTIPTSDRDGQQGVFLEVTGHFDDPRSDECSVVPLEPGYPAVSAENAELTCRQRFVVDAVTIVEAEE